MSEIRPVIGYIGREEYGHTCEAIPERAAHVFFLESDAGCRVIEVPFLEYDDVEGIDELIEANRRGLLVMLLTAESREYEGDDSTEREIQSARDRFGADLPIIVFPRYHDDRPEGIEEVSPNTYHANRTSPNLTQFIEERRDSCQGVLAERKRLAGPEMQALLHAYNTHYDDDHHLSTPDPNTKIVAEYIRCKLLPPEVLGEEFDNTLERPVNLPSVETGVFRQEAERIASMTDSERTAFMDLILEHEGCERAPNGGIMVKRATKGGEVIGFAIDADSLWAVKVAGFGMHAVAESRLHDYLEALDELRGLPEREHWKMRTIQGLIHINLQGFQSPVVQLFGQRVPDMSEYDAEYQRVGNHLLTQREMIPVDGYGRLINRDYQYKEEDV